MLSAVTPSKLTPATLARSLSHPAQYCLTVASCASPLARAGCCETPARAAGAAGAGVVAGDCAAVKATLNANSRTQNANACFMFLRIGREIRPETLERAADELVGI